MTLGYLPTLVRKWSKWSNTVQMARVTYDLLRKITFYVKRVSNNHISLLSCRPMQCGAGHYTPFILSFLFKTKNTQHEYYPPSDNNTDI